MKTTTAKIQIQTLKEQIKKASYDVREANKKIITDFDITCNDELRFNKPSNLSYKK